MAAGTLPRAGDRGRPAMGRGHRTTRHGPRRTNHGHRDANHEPRTKAINRPYTRPVYVPCGKGKGPRTKGLGDRFKPYAVTTPGRGPATGETAPALTRRGRSPAKRPRFTECNKKPGARPGFKRSGRDYSRPISPATWWRNNEPAGRVRTNSRSASASLAAPVFRVPCH